MITQAQFDTLMKEHQKRGVVSHAALKANMHRETAAGYLKRRVGPADRKQAHGQRDYRTRPDALAGVWPEVLHYLECAPELAREATALLAHLIATKPELTVGVSLRTLQERLQGWRAKHGPPKEVFFPQARDPAQSIQFDWFNANELGVTLAGQPFAHLLGHAVFPYSNWEWVLPCQSESSLSLRGGLQAALWTMGGVPVKLQMDHRSTATHTLRRDRERKNGSGCKFCSLAALGTRDGNTEPSGASRADLRRACDLSLALHLPCAPLSRRSGEPLPRRRRPAQRECCAEAVLEHLDS